MTFAEKNVAMSFEFAQKLVPARDIEEVTRPRWVRPGRRLENSSNPSLVNRPILPADRAQNRKSPAGAGS
jgi:hypothetical protein